MAQVHIIGRVTADFEMKLSQKKNPYVRFGIAETIGCGQAARTQYVGVWAKNEPAAQLVQSKVHKGSRIWITGSLELESFERQDRSKDKRLKVWLDNWGFVDSGKSNFGESYQMDSDPGVLLASIGVIDGERRKLP